VQKLIGFDEKDIMYFRKTQERYKTAHYDIFKREHDALSEKQRELICSGPNNEEIQKLVAASI
jgi:hypothetical protein